MKTDVLGSLLPFLVTVVGGAHLWKPYQKTHLADLFYKIWERCNQLMPAAVLSPFKTWLQRANRKQIISYATHPWSRKDPSFTPRETCSKATWPERLKEFFSPFSALWIISQAYIRMLLSLRRKSTSSSLRLARLAPSEIDRSVTTFLPRIGRLVACTSVKRSICSLSGHTFFYPRGSKRPLWCHASRRQNVSDIQRSGQCDPPQDSSVWVSQLEKPKKISLHESLFFLFTASIFMSSQPRLDQFEKGSVLCLRKNGLTSSGKPSWPR